MRPQNFLALDLELNKTKEYKNRIIQVGVAIGSPLKPEDIQTFSWYINPQEPIVPFIQSLTGITDGIIQEKSVEHKVVAEELGEIIKQNNCYVNPIVWGQGDVESLKYEFKENDIHFPFFGRRILDVKTIFVYKQIASGKSPAGGLRKSMNSYRLKFEGTPHRADIDAKNTLRFFFHLLNTENKTLNLLSHLKEL